MFTYRSNVLIAIILITIVIFSGIASAFAAIDGSSPTFSVNSFLNINL